MTPQDLDKVFYSIVDSHWFWAAAGSSVLGILVFIKNIANFLKNFPKVLAILKIIFLDSNSSSSSKTDNTNNVNININPDSEEHFESVDERERILNLRDKNIYKKHLELIDTLKDQITELEEKLANAEISYTEKAKSLSTSEQKWYLRCRDLELLLIKNGIGIPEYKNDK